ncbi:MAG TPA: AAA family ATPase [Candidatus Hydrogenedentes bacterium]|nr:AAA family ATPase [Candidatus Hydrogenedentota bacterium]HOL76653.1 AAA family ATPase [Candidatus Hydrogenedentota bacterium]HPO84486.1 AAA family ATPase [Candidatus Hydrogenedentota bacterium]
MYEAFFGLKEKPFNLTPDPRFLFLSEKHKEAFAHLLFGIKNRTGFVMVSGEIGTGKTTICRTLLSRLDPNTEVAFIFNPCLSPLELLRKINEDFGIETRGETIKDLIDELNQYLLDKFAEGKNCVLVIDEAQNLSPSVLEQIRLLSNLETETQKLLQIVLIGQPELMDNLNLPELRQLNQRITARYHLKALDRSETLQYIAYRLRVAGGRNRVWFTPRAIKAIYRASGGVPRVINAICDRALLIGYTLESRDITAAHVRQAIREIKGEQVNTKRWLWVKRYLPSPSLVAAAILILLVGKYFVAPFAERIRIDVPASVEAHQEAGRGFLTPPKADAVISPENENVKPAPMTTVAVTSTETGLDGLSPDLARNAAAIALLRVWNQAMISNYPKDDTPETLASFAAENGMQAEVLPLTFDQLLSVNLPAFIRVACKNHVIWAGLLSISDEGCRVASSPTSTLVVSKEELRHRYTNQAVILWRDVAPQSAVLRIGYKGPEVKKLQETLYRLGRLKVPASGVYDDQTAAAVSAIQAETGLKQDGIAGRQVRMVLSSWLGESGFPNLVPMPKPLVASLSENRSEGNPANAAETVASAVDVPSGDGKIPDVASSSAVENASAQGNASETAAPSENVEAQSAIPEPQKPSEAASAATSPTNGTPASEEAPNNQEVSEEKAVTPPSVSGVPLVPHGELTSDIKKAEASSE